MSRTALLVLAAALVLGCAKKVREQSVAPTTAVAAGARERFEQGVAHMEAGASRYDAAVQSFRAAIGIDPKLWEAWLDIGVIELRRARLAEAAKALQKSLEIYASPEALDALGEVYLRQGKAERAIELYERA
ncbi:MAG: tetratricopeptide repeat protein, partial [Deltaproteobacteria bacterium]|nr:tetratricopeptide repeat protein [Nannocystaceae bacterium]